MNYETFICNINNGFILQNQKSNHLSSILLESDNDNDDVNNKTIIARDRIREYLEKEPNQRTDDDIDFLLEFLQHMPALSNLTTSIRRALCGVMVFVVLDRVGTVVLRDGEKLKGWSIIINGHVEVANSDGTIYHLHMGDSFGVTASMDEMHHSGVMVTKTPDCQFVFIPQTDYCMIMNASQESIGRIEEKGELVMMIEKKNIGFRSSGHIVLRATPERLLQELLTDLSYDPNYIDDFLLTHKLFLKSSSDLIAFLTEKLLDGHVERVIAIMTRWITLYFEHFDFDSILFKFLEKFIAHIFDLSKPNDARVLMNMCSRFSHIRSVKCNPTDNQSAQFEFIRGSDDENEVFVSLVQPCVTLLRRADQILAINDKSIELFNDHQIFDILHSNDSFNLYVKSNLEGYHNNLSSTHISTRPGRCCSLPRSIPSSTDRHHSQSPIEFHPHFNPDPSFNPSRIKRIIGKFSGLQLSTNISTSLSVSMDSTWSGNRSLSSTSHIIDDFKTNLFNPYKCDLQTVVCLYSNVHAPKYFLITHNTFVKDLIDQAIVEFNLSESTRYVLYLYECDTKQVIKRKELLFHDTGLDNLYLLNNRFYLCEHRSADASLSSDLMQSMQTEIFSDILKLPANLIAHELTRRDFDIFRLIHPSDYINEIFDIESAPTFIAFSDLVNKEMFWVISEICSASSAIKRMKIIKHFVKIAKCCLDLRNYNSMFAILSGLRHGAVLRLRQSWERLPEKYAKLFEELEDLMDPSRNMSKYRNQLTSTIISFLPTIPFFPLIKKDLTFIHYGNDSRIDGLVNFDKLRMIAKEIRNINKMSMCSSLNDEISYDLGSRTSLLNISSPNISRKKLNKSPSVSLKKRHDENQIIRCAKTYLANLEVITNETKLLAMSIQCEPHENSSLNVQTYHENISQPKFGSDSLRCINKLMSLRETCKSPTISEHQPRPYDNKKLLVKKINSAKLKPLQLTLESSSVSSHPAIRFRNGIHTKKKSFNECNKSLNEPFSSRTSFRHHSHNSKYLTTKFSLSTDGGYDSGIDSLSTNPIFSEIHNFLNDSFDYNNCDSVFSSPTVSSKSII